MKLVCQKCGSNKWSPHSGWVNEDTIFTTHQCIICTDRQTVSESVEDFNSKIDSQKPINDVRNLLKK